jgi:hypothetical protein
MRRAPYLDHRAYHQRGVAALSDRYGSRQRLRQPLSIRLRKAEQVLPFGGEKLDYSNIQHRLKSAIAHARRAEEVPFDGEARKVWEAVYPDLAHPPGGLFGNVTARAEAQVRRLACLYALLDESSFVEVKHLQRQVSQAWKYCANSCRAIFGDATGDRLRRRFWRYSGEKRPG